MQIDTTNNETITYNMPDWTLEWAEGAMAALMMAVDGDRSELGNFREHWILLDQSELWDVARDLHISMRGGEFVPYDSVPQERRELAW